MLIMTVIGYFYFGSTVKNFLCAKLLGITYAISFIIIFLYTYTGIIGTNFAVLYIGSFFSTAFIVFTYFPPKINLFKDPVTETSEHVSEVPVNLIYFILVCFNLLLFS